MYLLVLDDATVFHKMTKKDNNLDSKLARNN